MITETTGKIRRQSPMSSAMSPRELASPFSIVCCFCAVTYTLYDYRDYRKKYEGSHPCLQRCPRESWPVHSPLSVVFARSHTPCMITETTGKIRRQSPMSSAMSPRELASPFSIVCCFCAVTYTLYDYRDYRKNTKAVTHVFSDVPERAGQSILHCLLFLRGHIHPV